MVQDPSKVFVAVNLKDTLTFPDIPGFAEKSSSI